MKQESENIFKTKYPKCFEYLNNEGSIPPIFTGINCGDGWYEIIDSLLMEINSYINEKESTPRKNKKHPFSSIINLLIPPKFRIYKKEESVPHIQITEITKRFGGLNIYYKGGDNYIQGLIKLAEEMSYKTCEQCGSTTNVGTTSGIIKTICKKCELKHSQNLNNWKPIKH